MKKPMGIALMVLGAVFFVSGVILYKQGSKDLNGQFSEEKLRSVIEAATADGVLTNNEKQLITDMAKDLGKNPEEALKMAEQLTASNAKTAETELIDLNQKNGLDFEKYVVRKFDKKFVSVKEWAGDKFVEGIYSKSNENPDIILELTLGNRQHQFAVECKFRTNYFKGGIEVGTPEQLARYQDFERERKMPVFLVIGVGGTGANPERVFVQPVRFVKSNFLPISVLEKAEIKNLDKNFFYDEENKLLK